MTIETLEEVLHDQLKDIYHAEHQLLKALPKMAKKAGSEELREALESHLRETEGQIERLDEVAEQLGVSLKGKKCKGMEGLIEEAKEVLDQDAPEPLLDANMIAACQKVEHYEISAYGSARAIAEKLGQTGIAELLEANLQEESAADEKLTEISEGSVLNEAMEFGEEEEEEGEFEEEEEYVSTSPARGRSHGNGGRAGRSSTSRAGGSRRR